MNDSEHLVKSVFDWLNEHDNNWSQDAAPLLPEERAERWREETFHMIPRGGDCGPNLKHVAQMIQQEIKTLDKDCYRWDQNVFYWSLGLFEKNAINEKYKEYDEGYGRISRHLMIYSLCSHTNSLFFFSKIEQ